MNIRSLFLCTILALFTGLFSSCGSDEPKSEEIKTLQLAVTHDMLIAGEGETAFTVTADGTDVTSKADIYLKGDFTPLSSKTYKPVMPGEFTFYATYAGKTSNEVTVTVEAPGPKVPADPQPQSTSFKQRIVLMQHTGTFCGHCPLMVLALRNIAQDKNYADRFTLVCLHSYNGDPMGTTLVREVSNSYMTGGWPYLSLNFKKVGTGAADTWMATCSAVKTLMDDEYAGSTPAGVCSFSAIDDNKLIVNLEVKADIGGDYRVGAWLLEDNLKCPQTNYHTEATGDEDFSIHNNVLRDVIGKQSDTDFSGLDLGHIDAGKTAKTSGEITLKPGWKQENCKLLIFVTRKSADNNYTAVNSAIAPIDGEKAYEYK